MKSIVPSNFIEIIGISEYEEQVKSNNFIDIITAQKVYTFENKIEVKNIVPKKIEQIFCDYFTKNKMNEDIQDLIKGINIEQYKTKCDELFNTNGSKEALSHIKIKTNDIEHTVEADLLYNSCLIDIKCYKKLKKKDIIAAFVQLIIYKYLLKDSYIIKYIAMFCPIQNQIIYMDINDTKLYENIYNSYINYINSIKNIIYKCNICNQEHNSYDEFRSHIHDKIIPSKKEIINEIYTIKDVTLPVEPKRESFIEIKPKYMIDIDNMERALANKKIIFGDNFTIKSPTTGREIKNTGNVYTILYESYKENIRMRDSWEERIKRDEITRTKLRIEQDYIDKMKEYEQIKDKMVKEFIQNKSKNKEYIMFDGIKIINKDYKSELDTIKYKYDLLHKKHILLLNIIKKIGNVVKSIKDYLL